MRMGPFVIRITAMASCFGSDFEYLGVPTTISFVRAEIRSGFLSMRGPMQVERWAVDWLVNMLIPLHIPFVFHVLIVTISGTSHPWCAKSARAWLVVR